MHQGGDFVIGEGRQLIESGHPVLHARPVMAVQDTAHVFKVCHHRHRLRLRNTLAPSVERVERRRFGRSRILVSWAALRDRSARVAFFGGKIETPFPATRIRPSSCCATLRSS